MSLPRKWAKKRRLMMDLSRRGLGGVSLGRYDYTSARPALEEHRHARAIEICFLVRGRQTYRVGGRSYRLAGGDIFLTFPGEWHSTGGLPEEKGALYWLTLDRPEDHQPFLNLPMPSARDLHAALLKIKVRHFRGSWKMKDALDRIAALFHEGRSALHRIALGHAVVEFLLEVLECSTAGSVRKESPPMHPVLEEIERHLDEPMSVARLAAVAGTSVSRFKARFKAEVGVPPAEYVLRARVAEAQRRLSAGKESVTRVAFDLGFSSSQYFATVYKRFFGHSPGQEGQAARKSALPGALPLVQSRG